VCVLTGVLYYILEKLDPGADDQNIEGDAGAAMYFSFITFTGHHEFNPRSYSARLLAFSLTFWALITAGKCCLSVSFRPPFRMDRILLLSRTDLSLPVSTPQSDGIESQLHR